MPADLQVQELVQRGEEPWCDETAGVLQRVQFPRTSRLSKGHGHASSKSANMSPDTSDASSASREHRGGAHR